VARDSPLNYSKFQRKSRKIFWENQISIRTRRQIKN